MVLHGTIPYKNFVTIKFEADLNDLYYSQNVVFVLFDLYTNDNIRLTFAYAKPKTPTIKAISSGDASEPIQLGLDVYNNMYGDNYTGYLKISFCNDIGVLPSPDTDIYCLNYSKSAAEYRLSIKCNYAGIRYTNTSDDLYMIIVFIVSFLICTFVIAALMKRRRDFLEERAWMFHNNGFALNEIAVKDPPKLYKLKLNLDSKVLIEQEIPVTIERMKAILPGYGEKVLQVSSYIILLPNNPERIREGFLPKFSIAMKFGNNHN